MPDARKLTLKELFYVVDTADHRKKVRDVMDIASEEILSRGRMHDESKYDSVEMESYVDPVWTLNHEEVAYGSDRYKELTAAMGEGWEHHWRNNDHHIEFLACSDPVPSLNLFILLEMCADWIAAAARRGNDPALAIDGIKRRYPLDPQVESLMRNTIRDLVKWQAEKKDATRQQALRGEVERLRGFCQQAFREGAYLGNVGYQEALDAWPDSDVCKAIGRGR